MGDPSSAESFIVRHYQLWQEWTSQYKYKHLKGARIAQILKDTGGLPHLAVELGIGPGGIASALSKEGVSVVGLDLSPDALQLAKQHCSDDSVWLMRASGFSLPFRECSISVLYAPQVLHLFDNSDRLALMRESYRVLTLGGRFLFDMKNALSHPWGYLKRTPDHRAKNYPAARDVAALLEQAGFVDVATLPGLLPRLPWTKMPDLGPLKRLAHTTFFVAYRAR